jgi:DNA invertase Pin-like site-specific DNA recombinase
MRIGYARVLTTDQNLDLQHEALKAAGCEHIFSDESLSGTARPGLDRALAALSLGDTLIVWKIDRVGRSLAHLVQLIADLGAKGIAFRSLSDPIDTGGAGGRPVLQMMSALAEFDRSLIVERAQAGMLAARRRGQKLGRKPSVTPEQIAMARRMIDNGESPRVVARSLKIGKSTLYRHLPGARSAEAEAPL